MHCKLMSNSLKLFIKILHKLLVSLWMPDLAFTILNPYFKVNKFVKFDFIENWQKIYLRIKLKTKYKI